MQAEQHDIGKLTTVDYYDREANAFALDTAQADVSEILGEFTELLCPGASVLDWGCGTGRDSHAMLNMGFDVTSTDISRAMCDKAAELFGINVACEGFGDLEAENEFDGIWACASLLHVPYADLPDVLRRAEKALKHKGVLYMSFKRGSFEGVRNGRWFTDLDEASLTRLIQSIFEMIRMWVTSDVRPGREDEKWLNCLLRKR